MKIGGMFKSPMTIIMILSFGLMFLLPKMMANLDPEQLEVSDRGDPLYTVPSLAYSIWYITLYNTDDDIFQTRSS